MNTETDSRSTTLFPSFRSFYNSGKFPLILAGVYFVVLVIFGLAFHKVGAWGAESDFYTRYAPEAREFIRGTITADQFQGPLYPWTVGLIGIIIGDLFRSGVIISAISGALSLYFIFEITKTLFSPDVALLSTVLVAVNGVFIQYSYTVGTDMFFAVLAFAGLYMLFRKPVISRLELAASALLVALACLVRYNGIVFLFAAALVILYRAVEVKGWTKYRAAAVFVLVFAVVTLPWAIYLKMKYGSFFYNENYQNVAYEVFAKDQETWEQFWFQFAGQFTGYWDVIMKSPGTFAWVVLKNIFTHLYYDAKWLADFWVGIPSIIGGVIFAFSHPDRRKVGLIFFFLSQFAVLLTVFYWNRFSLFLLPMYCIFFALLLKYLFTRLANKKAAVMKLLNSLAALAVILSFARAYSSNLENVRSDPTDIVLVRDWFHKHYGTRYDNARIASVSHNVSYLLGLEFHYFPMVDDYDSLIAVLKKDDVEFLYYGSAEIVYRPQFVYLLNIDTAAHPCLLPLCLTHKPPAVLYKVTDCTGGKPEGAPWRKK